MTISCAETNYIFEAVAALFAALFVGSEVVGTLKIFDCHSISQLLICTCGKANEIVVRYATPRSSIDSQMPRVSVEVRASTEIRARPMTPIKDVENG